MYDRARRRYPQLARFVCVVLRTTKNAFSWVNAIVEAQVASCIFSEHHDAANTGW